MARSGDDRLTAAVTSVLARVMKVESYLPADNFFLLGGDSLLATRAARELSRELGRPVSAREILLHPTASELSDFLRGG